jgi:hypothetical protein
MKPITVDLRDLQVPIQWPETIIINGQYAQDLFVVAMTQGKMNGTWLEIGCGHSMGGGTNTLCLEKYFQWNGISIDSGEAWDVAYSNGNLDLVPLSQEWASNRPAVNFIQTDALELDYKTFPKRIDYLQIDIDSPEQSLLLLKKVTRDINFSVITFEHDVHITKNPIKPLDKKNCEQYYLARSQSREWLQDLGYQMVVGNVHGCEDWWIDPKIISLSAEYQSNKSWISWQNILINHDARQSYY